VALLLLALPGVRRLMGWSNFLPEKRQVLVTEELIGQESWTQLVYGRVKYADGVATAVPLRSMTRLEAMAAANVLIEVPEGTAVIRQGGWAEAWFFSR
jgi:molybdopterin biosynthesis enzyme